MIMVSQGVEKNSLMSYINLYWIGYAVYCKHAIVLFVAGKYLPQFFDGIEWITRGMNSNTNERYCTCMRAWFS